MTVFSGSPLASLISGWLAALAPAPATIPNPPLTYQQIDFNIWTQKLDGTDPQGYLDLDLEALTEGYIIPPFQKTPATASGSTLTFTVIGLGIGPGCLSADRVSLLAQWSRPSNRSDRYNYDVTLSAAASSTATLTFNDAALPATTNADCPLGNALTFAATTGIRAGMSVFGVNTLQAQP